jgi:hypothetical protein
MNQPGQTQRSAPTKNKPTFKQRPPMKRLGADTGPMAPTAPTAGWRTGLPLQKMLFVRNDLGWPKGLTPEINATSRSSRFQRDPSHGYKTTCVTK